jgi:hypothetical protein
MSSSDSEHEVHMATPQWLICKDCGRPFRTDEGQQFPTVLGCGASARAATFADPVYNWSPDNGYCLECWLMV